MDIPGQGLVVGEGDGAVLALQLFAAGAADDDEGIAAAVEQDDGLLAAVERRLRFFDQRAGEELLLAGLLEFGTHVDEADFGQRTLLDAFAHLDALILPGLSVLPGFERRRGRAKNDGRLGEFGADHGDIAGVIAGHGLLLVTGVVLLVHDNQAQVFDRSKDGRASADHDAGFAFANAVPLLAALFGGESGVEQGDFGSEGVVQLGGHGGGEADFRNQQDRGSAGVERATHGREVDRGFTGAGDAVQQKGTESTRLYGFGDGGEGGLLRRVQRVIGREGVKVGEMKIGGALLDADQLAFDQSGERGGRHVEAVKFGDGQLAVGAGQLGEDGLLIFVELRQTHTFDENRVADGASGIARLSSGFAGDPLLAQHTAEESGGGPGGGAETRSGHGFSGFECVKDGIFVVLLFGRKLRTARGTLLGGGKESLSACVGDAVEDAAADFLHEGQHGAEDFADGREIILGDPAAEVH